MLELPGGPSPLGTPPVPKAPAEEAVVVPLPSKTTGPDQPAELLPLITSEPALILFNPPAPLIRPLSERVLPDGVSMIPPRPVSEIARLVEPVAPVKRSVPALPTSPMLIALPAPSGLLAPLLAILATLTTPLLIVTAPVNELVPVRVTVPPNCLSSPVLPVIAAPPTAEFLAVLFNVTEAGVTGEAM